MACIKKGERTVAKRAGAVIAVLVLACLTLGTMRAADKPLSQDDITLLLLGGASTEKMLTLIEQRGVDFRMNPDLAKKFHDAGADDLVIEALQKAGARVQPATAVTAPAPPAGNQGQASGAEASATTPPATRGASDTAAAPSTGTPTAETSSPAGAKSKGSPKLTDPSPEEISKIIQEFAAKEELFREARNNYTYHQVNRLNELDSDGNTVGTYQQEWDILYDDSGKRIERVTYAPVATLVRLGVTREDLDAMRNIQPFVLTTAELPEYDVKYLGHVKVDEITAYVFSIRPKVIQKNRLYFQGTVWVDDRDLQIVKSNGKSVPEVRSKNENLFPRFTTYREQIDGKYWFPTFTLADDTLYFATGPVHIKMTIRYTDYKQFKSKVRILSTAPADTPTTPPSPKK
jgi:hypothetical protein